MEIDSDHTKPGRSVFSKTWSQPGPRLEVADSSLLIIESKEGKSYGNAIDGSMQILLRKRARTFSGNLTKLELAVLARFIVGESQKAIARERQLSAGTISSLIRSVCHKLGFDDGRKLKGWS